MRAHFLMRAAEPIPATLLASKRQAARDEVARQDAERLRDLRAIAGQRPIYRVVTGTTPRNRPASVLQDSWSWSLAADG
jgi:hypothetical protein